MSTLLRARDLDRSFGSGATAVRALRGVDLSVLIVIGVLGLLIGTMAAILPARRAARLDPLKALTYE